MRLIDADALRDELTRYVFMAGDGTAALMQAETVMATVGAAPTICCERCEHDQYCYRTLEWHIMEGRRDKHYPRACDLFQPQDEAAR